MGIEDIFDQMAEDVFTELGQEATFLPAVGEEKSCRVNLRETLDLQPNNLDMQFYDQSLTLEAVLTDLGQTPKSGDRFTVGERHFLVRLVTGNDGRFVTMIVTEE